jgi:hypothetical protein
MSTEALASITERRRETSPAIAPQALAWHQNTLWMGSRDLRRVYQIQPDTWEVLNESEAPGIPWAATSTGKAIYFNLGEGAGDDRYLRLFDPGSGFSATDRVPCPEFTGSYISHDGSHLYLSQWYKHRILKLDDKGEILRVYEMGAEICAHTFFGGVIYVVRGTEQGDEDWRIARFDPDAPSAQVEDLAKVPFQCRSLTFDGSHFWANHRPVNEIVCFDLPQ